MPLLCNASMAKWSLTFLPAVFFFWVLWNVWTTMGHRKWATRHFLCQYKKPPTILRLPLSSIGGCEWEIPRRRQGSRGSSSVSPCSHLIRVRGSSHHPLTSLQKQTKDERTQLFWAGKMTPIRSVKGQGTTRFCQFLICFDSKQLAPKCFPVLPSKSKAGRKWSDW